MKKACAVLLTLLSILLLACPALADGVIDSLAGTAYNPLSAALTVYAEPKTSSAVVGQVSGHGYAMVDKVRHLADNTLWAYVMVEEKTNFSGWVEASSLIMTDYLLVVNPVAGDRLNLRASPSTKAASLGKFYTGAVVEALGKPSGQWQKVSVGGLEGYMMCDYLSPVVIGDAVSHYDDMPPMVTIHTACTSSVLPSAFDPVINYDAGERVQLLAVRADGMALIKLRSLGMMQDTGWVKSSALTPTPSFSSGGSGASADTSNLMIVVNPDSTDRLNLRESADGRSASLGKYYTGAVVTVTDTTNSSWALATIGTETGYMDMNYLIPYSDKAAAEYAALLPTVKVQNSGGTGLNLRSYASTSGALLQTIPNGASLTVLGITANGWAYVQVGDIVGYVLAKWLSPAITFAK